MSYYVLVTSLLRQLLALRNALELRYMNYI